MAWTKSYKRIRDVYGSVIANVRVIVDYNGTNNRIAALLEVKDYSTTGVDITIDPSDATATTWQEGTDFTAETSKAVTAENIATAINTTTNYTASADTGHEGNPWVSIVYTAGGYLSSISTTNTAVYKFYSGSKATTGVPKLAQDDSGTIKHQPLWTDSNGQYSFYIDAPTDIDLNYQKSGYNFDNTYSEDIDITVGTTTALSDSDKDTIIKTEETVDEDKVRIDTGGTERMVIDSTGIDAKGNSLKNVSTLDATSHREVSDEGLVLGMNFNSDNLLGSAGSETVLDSSGKNNHGINHGATHQPNGGFNGGGAFDFDGVDDYIALPSGMWPSIGAVIVWAKANWSSMASGDGRLFGGDDSSGNEVRTYEQSGKIISYFDTDGGNILTPQCFGTARADGEWIMVAFSWEYSSGTDETTCKAFGNGNLNEQETKGGQILSQDNSLKIAWWSGSYFPGDISNFSLYNRALSEDEIQALYYQRAETEDSCVGSNAENIPTSDPGEPGQVWNDSGTLKVST